MAAEVLLVVPVNEVMYVRDTNYGEFVIQRNLERFSRVGVAVGNLDTVQMFAGGVCAMKFRYDSDAAWLLRCPVRVIPENESALFVCSFDCGLRGPQSGCPVVSTGV